MASLRTLVSPNRRAAARFVGGTRRRLAKALADRPDVTRSAIARALGVHRSVVTKHFNGTKDMTLGRVAELAWSLGYEPELVLVDVLSGVARHNNAVPASPAQDVARSQAAVIKQEGKIWQNRTTGFVIKGRVEPIDG